MIFFLLLLHTLSVVCVCVSVWTSDGMLLCLHTQNAQALDYLTARPWRPGDHLAAGRPPDFSSASNSPACPSTRLRLPASYSAVPEAFPKWKRSAPGFAPAEGPSLLCSLLASLALLVSQRVVSCLSGDSEPALARQTSKCSHHLEACNHTFFNGV